MDANVGVWLLVLFGALIALGAPIAIAIAWSSLAVIFMVVPFKVGAITAGQKLVTGMDSFSLLAIPFFVLAGNIMNQGGIAQRLVNFAKLIVGRMPGSLAHVNVVSNMFFGAVSGSAVAAAAAVGKTLAPQIKKEGYDPAFIAAVNIASCPTGMLIPPSNGLIVYSVISGGTSVGALFLGGYVPGILMGLACMTVAYVIVKRRGYDRAQAERPSGAEALKIVGQALPSLGLIAVVIGGIVGGVFTATEGACVAVLYSLLLSVCYRALTPAAMWTIFKETAEISGVVLFLIGTSTIMSWAMAYTGLPEAVSAWMLSISDSRIVLLLMMNVLLLTIGMFMDMTPALLIFTPIFLPIAVGLGLDPVHFGLMMVFNLCIGICTPPVGTALFVGCGVARVPLEPVIRMLVPFCLAEVAILLLVTYVPELSLALPRLAGML